MKILHKKLDSTVLKGLVSSLYASGDGTTPEKAIVSIFKTMQAASGKDQTNICKKTIKNVLCIYRIKCCPEIDMIDRLSDTDGGVFWGTDITNH